MRTISTISGIACSVLLFFSTAVFADSAAVSTMAEITMSLNHFPSDEDKQELSAIASSADSSESEVAVATAMTNMKHQLTDADKATLGSIAADADASAGLRELAGILLNIKHHASDTDKVVLEKIVAAAGS
jgi:hypothetical protein